MLTRGEAKLDAYGWFRSSFFRTEEELPPSFEVNLNNADTRNVGSDANFPCNDPQQATAGTLNKQGFDALAHFEMESIARCQDEQNCLANMGVSVKNTFLDVDQRASQNLRMVHTVDGLPFVDASGLAYCRTEEDSSSLNRNRHTGNTNTQYTST